MADSSKPGFREVAQESHLYHPQEALLKTSTKKEKLVIGIPKETAWQENRIPLSPESVSVITANGHEVRVEAGAGQPSKFSDHEYSEAGAEIMSDTKEVFASPILLKIQPPTKEELGYLKTGQVLISTLQIANLDASFFQELQKKKITAVALELIEDKVGSQPVVRAMSEIAGSSTMMIAAEYLSNTKNGMGVILGGITGVPPTEVVILGAGTVAEFAARTALGLGADVKIFDNRIYRLRRLKYNLGAQVYTSTIDTAVLANAIAEADVVIGALRASHGRTPCIVTEEMVQSMKPNSLIIDVSIDNGGCFETSAVTTHKSPTFRKHDVIHYCVPNIASRVPKTASTAFSHIITPYLMQAAQMAGMEAMISQFKWFRKGTYLFKGMHCHKDLSDQFGLSYKDLDLLLAARI